jgi:hypothetical protein
MKLIRQKSVLVAGGCESVREEAERILTQPVSRDVKPDG